jgi:hypothetical protein
MSDYIIVSELVVKDNTSGPVALIGRRIQKLEVIAAQVSKAMTRALNAPFKALASGKGLGAVGRSLDSLTKKADASLTKMERRAATAGRSISTSLARGFSGRGRMGTLGPSMAAPAPMPMLGGGGGGGGGLGGAMDGGGGFGGLLAGAGALAGLGGMVSGVISLNNELDQANAGMATLISGITGTGIADSMEIARDVVKDLRKDAAVGVGELSNYVEGFQKIMGPGLTGGASLEQMRDLTRTSLAAGFAMRGGAGLEQAPMDIVQALTGGVNDRQTPIALAALQAIGQDVSKFNDMKMKDKIDTLVEGFGKFDAGVAVMGKTWEAQSSTFIDVLKEVVRTVTRPIFETWLGKLQATNEWLSKNQDLIFRNAELIRDAVGKGWAFATENLRSYAQVLASVVALQAAGGVAGVAGGMGKVSKGASGVAGIPAALKDPLGIGSMMGVAGATKGVLPAFTALGNVLSKVVAPVAIVTTVVTSLFGALAEWPVLGAFLAEVSAQFMGSLAMLGASFGSLTAKGSILNMVGGVLVLAFSGLIMLFTWVVQGVTALVLALGGLAQVLGAVVTAIGQALMGDFKGAWDTLKGIGGIASETFDSMKKITDDLLQPPKEPNLEPPGESKDLAKNKSVTNINGPVSIVVRAETMEDPARVAFSMETVFSALSRNPTQARRSN